MIEKEKDQVSLVVEILSYAEERSAENLTINFLLALCKE
jgi:hypothetical protein